MKFFYVLLAAVALLVTGCESQHNNEAFKSGGSVGGFGGGSLSSGR